jgi:hypothetical protein
LRILKSPAFWVLLVALSIVVAANWNNDTNRSSSMAGELEGRADGTKGKMESGSSSSLIREGTELTNIRARISKASASGRILLYEEQPKRTLICLENLWLHRIITAQKNEDQGIVWSISGRVTEFDGQNYIQILQASKTN